MPPPPLRRAVGSGERQAGSAALVAAPPLPPWFLPLRKQPKQIADRCRSSVKKQTLLSPRRPPLRAQWRCWCARRSHRHELRRFSSGRRQEGDPPPRREAPAVAGRLRGGAKRFPSAHPLLRVHPRRALELCRRRLRLLVLARSRDGSLGGALGLVDGLGDLRGDLRRCERAPVDAELRGRGTVRDGRKFTRQVRVRQRGSPH